MSFTFYEFRAYLPPNIALTPHTDFSNYSQSIPISLQNHSFSFQIPVISSLTVSVKKGNRQISQIFKHKLLTLAHAECQRMYLREMLIWVFSQQN
jgi:hypothetical protein